MHKFHFRPGKSAFMGLIMAGAALFAGWSWATSPTSGWLAATLALLCGAGAVKVAMDAMSDTPAVAFDSAGLRIRRTWGQVVELPWSEVRGMTLEVMTLRYWGIIPIAKHENLCVQCDGGLFGSRKHRLALKMVQLPAGGAAQLMDMLHAAHLAAVGEVAPVTAGRLRSEPAKEAAADFDADQALARYLARKDAAPLQETPVAAAQAASPPRPTFGRKVQAG